MRCIMCQVYIRQFLYEERFTPSGELEQCAKVLDALEVSWEVLCHLHIYMDLGNWRKGGVSITKWGKYLIGILKLPKTLSPVWLAKVKARFAAMEACNAKEKDKCE